MKFFDFLDKNFKLILIFTFFILVFFWLSIYSYEEVSINGLKTLIRKDRITGATEMFVEFKMTKKYVALSLQEKLDLAEESEKEKVITLAKSAKTLDDDSNDKVSNEHFIKRELVKMGIEGPMLGWHASKNDEVTYSVIYSSSGWPGARSWFFEVVPATGKVRNATFTEYLRGISPRE